MAMPLVVAMLGVAAAVAFALLRHRPAPLRAAARGRARRR
jgi:hypothetical protein